MTVLLHDLIDPQWVLGAHGRLDVPIARIVTDSRQVSAGDLFVCLPGYRTEGGEVRADRHDFISVALQRGAAALLVERKIEPIPGVTVVRVADAWAAVAEVSCRYYGDPSRQLLVVGVTGTSGKTSTTYFIEAVLQAAGHRVARFGTIEYKIGDVVLPAVQTTPEAPVIQALLRRACDAGCTAAVMEVSSHALELRRVGGIAFDVAVFTNLSQDHLNFHPDMHHYVRAKGRLFEELSSGGKCATAVVNVDDPASEHIVRVNRGSILTYAIDDRAATIRAQGISATLRGATFTARTPQGSAAISLGHLGEYSVYNALAAVAVGHAVGVNVDAIRAGVGATPPVPGRFELIDEKQGFVVGVDYAHKPDALRRLLESARRLGPRRIITVFGCGGDRDRGKRPLMGRIAIELSDYVVVTSDNPRSEDPRAIVDEILTGVRPLDPTGERHAVEIDRRKAIHHAVRSAGPDDIVLIAGKGHETYQLVGGIHHDFDDRVEAIAAIRALTVSNPGGAGRIPGSS
jgi:UDP-N-acetylmuramoyl-L-alanyl-D-glutamate--2,6-diaminopimelate ligase